MQDDERNCAMQLWQYPTQPGINAASTAPVPVGQMQFCFVPAGPFWMGRPDSDKDAQEDEKPLHQVDIAYDFWMGRYPVTVAQFAAFAHATGYRTTAEKEDSDDTWLHPDGRDSNVQGELDHPVTAVTWHDALAFCDWLRRMTNMPVVLPSEAEWEKAARGGVRISGQPVISVFSSGFVSTAMQWRVNGFPQRRYPWGDKAPDTLRCNTCFSPLSILDTTPVGRYSPRGDSPYGCADMAGNVWELTRSLWGQDWKPPDYKYPYDPHDKRREDLYAAANVMRVLRGGSWSFSEDYVRCSCRGQASPNLRGHGIGFRVVVSPFTSGL